MADSSSQILNDSAGPKSAAMDGLAGTAHPIQDRIAAVCFDAAVQAASKRGRGLRFTKLIGPAQCPSPPSAQDPGLYDFGSYS